MSKRERGLGWRAGAAAVALLALGACSDRTLDTGVVGSVFGGSPPPEAPSPVRGMTGERTSYPNLATVPGRPTDVPPVAQRQKDITALEQERAQARSTAKALEDRYKPVPVPPQPKIAPGRSG